MNAKSSSLINVAITANILEWYDFSISGFVAIILGELFFAEHDTLTAVIKSFSVFAVSYLMRPLGSMAFGYLGNKRSPGVALQWSTLLMAIPTIFMGFLPTYRDIGYSATVLMLMLRLIQGFAAGGEFPLSAYFVASHATDNNKGRLSSLVHVGGSLGVLLASFVAFLIGSLFEDRDIERWAWRLPFLLGIPLFLIVWKIRNSMFDNQLLVQETPCRSRTGWATRSSTFICGALLVASMEVGFYILLVWFPNYVEVFLRYSRFDAHLSNTLALIVYTATILTSGFLSSYLAHKKILIACLSSIVILTYPLFAALLHIHIFSLLLAVQFIFAMLYGGIGGVILLTLYQLFKDKEKSLGLAVTFTVPTALFGGTAPLVCSYLVRQFHNLYLPAFYVAAFCLFALPAAFSLADSGKQFYVGGTR